MYTVKESLKKIPYGISFFLYIQSDLQVNSGKTLQGIALEAQRQIVHVVFHIRFNIHIRIKERCGQIRRKETKYSKSILLRKYHLQDSCPSRDYQPHADTLHYKQHRCFDQKQRYRYYPKHKQQNRYALLIVLWIFEEKSTVCTVCTF